jgi:ankyrin repeat protein
MTRSTRARLGYWIQDAQAYVGPIMLGVTVYCLSTLAFFYSYRNDMLILAAQQRSLRFVKTFRAIGATAAFSTDIFPDSALIMYLHALQSPGLSALEGRELAETLLGAGASVMDRNGGGWTPLMLAASAGSAPIVEALLAHGAPIDARVVGGEQTEGMTALMAAALHGHANVIRLLIERGANVQLKATGGFTALTLATSKGYADCVDLLIKKGATVAATMPQVAERAGHVEIAERLRQAHPKFKVNPIPRHPARYPEK